MVQENLTQMGDVLISFPFLGFFVIYAPRMWEALLTSSMITLIASVSLKKLFAVPRPAAVFDNDCFVIVGRALKGHSSFPSGHSMAAFMVMGVVFFAFMPKNCIYRKTTWSVLLLTGGLIIAFSRVAVGAHYPADVLAGSLIGFLIAVTGILASNKFSWLHLIKTKHTFPILATITILWMILLVEKIININLPIFYLSLLSLIATFALIIKAHAKRI